MIGPILATLIAFSPISPQPEQRPVEQECVDVREYATYLSQKGAKVLEILRDSRVEKVTDTVRNLTNALDDYLDDPDSYVILATTDENLVIVIPLYGLCVSSPLYMKKDFYEDIRGVPLAPTKEI